MIKPRIKTDGLTHTQKKEFREGIKFLLQSLHDLKMARDFIGNITDLAFERTMNKRIQDSFDFVEGVANEYETITGEKSFENWDSAKPVDARAILRTNSMEKNK